MRFQIPGGLVVGLQSDSFPINRYRIAPTQPRRSVSRQMGTDLHHHLSLATLTRLVILRDRRPRLAG
jgi:hypothetical protein